MRIVEDGWSRWHTAFTDVARMCRWPALWARPANPVDGWRPQPAPEPVFDEATSVTWRSPSGLEVWADAGEVGFGRLGGWVAMDVTSQAEQDTATRRSADPWKRLTGLAEHCLGSPDELSDDEVTWHRGGGRILVERLAPADYGPGLSGVQFRLRVLAA